MQMVVGLCGGDRGGSRLFVGIGLTSHMGSAQLCHCGKGNEKELG